MSYNIIRPRRGIKSLWNQYKSRVYKAGEMLVESPETGIGSGPVNIKFGDGYTDYEHLPYAVLAPTDAIEEGVNNPLTSGGAFAKFNEIDEGVNAALNCVETITGVNPTFTSPDDGMVLFDKFTGGSTQTTYTGKNLLRNTGNTVTVSGITYTVNADGSITANGTATSDAYFTVGVFKPTVGESYRFTSVTTGCYLTGVNGVSDWKHGSHSWTAETNDDIQCRIYTKSGTTRNNETFYPMIRLLSIENDTYEPYVGGVASPNPDYPQGIGNAEVHKATIVGKNLWTLGDVSGTQYVNKSFRLEAGTYTISAVVTSSDTDGSTSLMNFVFEDGSTGGVALGRNTRESKTVTLGKNVTNAYIYAGLDFSKSKDDTFTWSDIQIEKGRVATSYEPYKKNTIELSTPVTLRGLGDVKDIICKQGNVWGVLRRVGSIVFNGSEAWTATTLNRVYNTSIAIKIKKPIDNKTKGNARCSHYAIRGKDGLDTGCFAIETTGALFFLDNTNGTSASTFKTWLQSNNITVVYELATPVFEPLPLADQAKLYQLECFKGINYLTVVTQSVSNFSPEVEIEVGANVTGVEMIAAKCKSEYASLFVGNTDDAIEEVRATAESASDTASTAIVQLGGCYFKHEDGKFYIGYDDGTTQDETEV